MEEVGRFGISVVVDEFETVGLSFEEAEGVEVQRIDEIFAFHLWVGTEPREDEVVNPAFVEVGPHGVGGIGDVAEDAEEGAFGVDAGVVRFSAGDDRGVGQMRPGPLAYAEVAVPIGGKTGKRIPFKISCKVLQINVLYIIRGGK